MTRGSVMMLAISATAPKLETPAGQLSAAPRWRLVGKPDRSVRPTRGFGGSGAPVRPTEVSPVDRLLERGGRADALDLAPQVVQRLLEYAILERLLLTAVLVLFLLRADPGALGHRSAGLAVDDIALTAVNHVIHHLLV